MKFRFQLNGVIEFGGKMTITEVAAHLSKELVGSELNGITIFEMMEKKDKGGRKRRPYVRLADRH